VERRDLVDRLRLTRATLLLFPWAEVSYMTMFTRHVEPRCDSHMSAEDVLVMDSVRRDVIEMLNNREESVTVLE
jgi:hypothetical protein